jgi:NAD(P)H dehydrogenase (quinone)
MQISIILAHPDKNSFNHAIASACVKALEQNQHQVCFHDLYEEKFDALLVAEEIPKDAHLSPGLKSHCDELSSSDAIIVIHPNWWGQPPAILKGWVDRVIRPGVAYEFLEGDNGERIPRGLLKAGRALVFNTSNTEPQREKEIFKDPLETIWKNCIFALCGINDFYRRMFAIVILSDEEKRKEWLAEVTQTINGFFPRTPEIEL